MVFVVVVAVQVVVVLGMVVLVDVVVLVVVVAVKVVVVLAVVVLVVVSVFVVVVAVSVVVVLLSMLFISGYSLPLNSFCPGICGSGGRRRVGYGWAVDDVVFVVVFAV